MPRPELLASAPAEVMETSDQKLFCPFILRKSLITLDSRERIQGNPRKSNPHNWWICDNTARGQENPNGTTDPTSRRSSGEEGSNQLFGEIAVVDLSHLVDVLDPNAHAMADRIGAFSPINSLTHHHLGTPRNFSDKAGVKLTNIDR
jgi:hypothetical protein